MAWTYIGIPSWSLALHFMFLRRDIHLPL